MGASKNGRIKMATKNNLYIEFGIFFFKTKFVDNANCPLH